MEVLNCTVDYVPGVRCTVWAPTQSAKSALSLVAALTGLAADSVTINVTYLGGGLGRKAELDFVSQAVQVAMAIQRPVKLMWPREEDFSHDQYRPMALVHARAGMDAAGYIAGWTYRNVSPSILASAASSCPPPEKPGQRGVARAALRLRRPTHRVGEPPVAVPVGFWRSVGASINTFAVESMIDELAAAAQQDPYQFRRARLNRRALARGARRAQRRQGVEHAARRGTARGIASAPPSTASSRRSSSLQQRRRPAGDARLGRDRQLPDRESGLGRGADRRRRRRTGSNAALYGRQTFLNGAATTKNFNTSRMIRLSEMPSGQRHILPAPRSPIAAVPIGGVGELGVPTLATGTGQRLVQAERPASPHSAFFPTRGWAIRGATRVSRASAAPPGRSPRRRPRSGAQRGAGVAAAEAVGAERHAAPAGRQEGADLLGHRAHVVGGDDDRPARRRELLADVAADRARRAVPPRGLRGDAGARQLAEAGDAPEVGGQAVLGLQHRLRPCSPSPSIAPEASSWTRFALSDDEARKPVHAAQHALVRLGGQRRLGEVLVHRRHVVEDVLLLDQHLAHAAFEDDGELAAVAGS
jgi:hypothetical protein